MCWPPLMLLCIGLANVPAWYGLAFWHWPVLYSICGIVGLAFLAGLFTDESTWFTVVVLIVPVMFVGSDRHGRPLDWLLLVVLYPLLSPLAVYLLVSNLGPLVLAYALVVKAGRVCRKEFQRRVTARKRRRAPR